MIIPICEECGLPLLLCDAKAFERKAQESAALGRKDEADSYAQMAAEAYCEYGKKSPGEGTTL